MPVSARTGQAPLEVRLNARRGELEQATFARIAAIADPAVRDPVYLAGLRTALTVALDYGLDALARPGHEPGPVPVQLLAQTRLAVRNGVSLGAVLRRYAAGNALLADMLLDEAAAVGIGAAELKTLLRTVAAHYDRVVVAVSEEYRREAETVPRSAEQRRCALLRRLIAGEPVHAPNFGYEFDAHHIAIVATGAGAVQEVLNALGERFDRCLLLVEPDDETIWAWLGGRDRFDFQELDFVASISWPSGASVACGAPGEGIGGWRLSHRQASAALPVVQRLAKTFVHYVDVALLAAVLQDDLLATSLQATYLSPLRAVRSGAAAKETLGAYFSAAGNISSAAAALGVSRHTVSGRLGAIEKRLGRPIDAVSAELQLALRLDEFEGFRTAI